MVIRSCNDDFNVLAPYNLEWVFTEAGPGVMFYKTNPYTVPRMKKRTKTKRSKILRKKAKKQVRNRRAGVKLPVAKNKRKMVQTKIQARVKDISEFKPEDQKDLLAVEAIKAGNKEEFKRIMDRYVPFLTHKIFHMVKSKEMADDCVADIMEKVYRNIGMYKQTNTFNSWVNFLAKNYMIDFSRKPIWKEQLNNVSFDNMFEGDEGEGTKFSDTLVDTEAITDERIQKQDENKVLAEAISALDEQERSIMQLICFKNMKYDEVAATEGIPIGTVKAVLFRSKKKVSMYIARVHPEIANYYISIAKDKPQEVSFAHKKEIVVDGEEHFVYSV